jgi:putative hydrolase of the HAD superfamily
MNFAEVDAVTLDCLGTLIALDDPTAALVEALTARGRSRDAETVRAAFAVEVVYYRAHLGEGRDDDSLKRLRERCAAVFLGALDVDLDAAGFAADFVGALRFTILPGVAATLRSLRSHGLELAVVSNWDVGLHEHLAALGLRSLIGTIVTSAEVGAAKPDPTVLEIALQRMGVAAARALHIGDGDEDAGAAAAAGVRFEPAPLAAVVTHWS